MKHGYTNQESTCHDCNIYCISNTDLIDFPRVTIHAATLAFSKSNFHHPLKIDNKYFPLKPGTTFIYKGTKEGDPTRDTFEVTSKVKVIAGITTREIHDKLFTKGVLTESTQDWFAQDDNGNVWYFGEFTTDFTNGENP